MNAGGAPALFDPQRHEPLGDVPWSETAAREAIVRIVRSACDEFAPGEGGWRCHPQDDPETPDQRFHGLYLGTAGVVWALDWLARQGAATAGPDAASLLHGLVERNREALQGPLHGTASLMLGDAGVLWAQWRLAREPQTEQALFDVVQGNLHNPVWEPLWGSSGTVLPAIDLAERTGQTRWRDLVVATMEILRDHMIQDEPLGGAWLWEQDLYGRRVRYLGAGHGMVGNVFPALRGRALLPTALVDELLDRSLHTLEVSALHDGQGGANWHPLSAEPGRLAGRMPLVQDCHGAPGVVCRLAESPRTPRWEAVLDAAGELTWRAGPLTKGPSLCHGTAGSGMACLKLWRRTGHPRWLDRARALAMHAIGQVDAARARHGVGRHTLWTGDLGVACFVWNCVVGSDHFPTLDRA